MILNWTSSVNKDTLTNVEGITYEEMMRMHVWNLYTNLTASGWQKVSSSYYAYTDPSPSYKTGSSWENINHIVFPQSLTSSNSTWETIELSGGVYKPSEHSWATLKKKDSNENWCYLTIDCRYPLPPHKENVSVMYDSLVDKYSFKKPKYNIPLGVAAINAYEMIDSTAVEVTAYREEQNLDKFYGICERENNIDNLSFKKTEITGQTNNSKAVSFMDITISNVAPKHVVSTEYVSCTTSVRPKNGQDDKTSIYICWGFDSMEAGKTIKDVIPNYEYSKYKYHFHSDPGTVAFIYQLSTRDVTEGFDCVFGILPVQNASTSDTYPWTTVAINVDPGYNIKSYCKNTYGSSIIKKLVEKPQTLNDEQFNLRTKDIPNTFYNTCFRNYNFSDGISSIRFGNVQNVRKVGRLPVHTPLSPSDATLYASPSSGLNVEKDTTFQASFNSENADKVTDDKNVADAPTDTEENINLIMNSFKLKTMNSDLPADKRSNELITSREKAGQFKVVWKKPKDTTLASSTTPLYYFDSSTKLFKNFKIITDPVGGGGSRYTDTRLGSVAARYRFSTLIRVTDATFANISKDKIDPAEGPDLSLGTNNFVVTLPDILAAYRASPATTTFLSNNIIFTSSKNSASKRDLPKYPYINGYKVDKDNFTEVYVYIGKMFKAKLNTSIYVHTPGVSSTSSRATGDQVISHTISTVATSGNDYYTTTSTIDSSSTIYKMTDIGFTPTPTSTLKNFVESLATEEVDVYIKVSLKTFISFYKPAVLATAGVSGVPEEWGSDLVNWTNSFKVESNIIYDYSLPKDGSGRYQTLVSPLAKEGQTAGTSAFSVFKSFSQNGQTSLIAAKYNFMTHDITGSLMDNNFDVFETSKAADALDYTNGSQVISMGRVKNSFDNSYSELPIFLLNSDENAPALKGYVTDLYWGPKGVVNGSLVPNNDTRYKIGGTMVRYQKIFWKGWWMPWVTNDSADW